VIATLRHRDFALLWTAGLISVAGDFALLIALPLHAYALTGSAVATGGVFAASLLPQVLFGSVAGVFVDRWDRKRTMVAADLLRAALLLPLLAVGSPDLLWLLYLVRAATGVGGLIFDPAESALLPRLVGEERLVTANALNALNNNIGRLVGPVAGGLLYAAGGLPAVVIVDAASFALSAALIMAIRANARPEREGESADGASPWARMAM
jgi:MFS family permease